jgi:ABC-type nitrate/sulfonate/bicarbonate transport system substrate-binding protein
MTWFPVKVAVEKGFLRNEGLEPQLIQMNGNVATVALTNGHIDFSLNISPVLNGAIQGLGLKLVTALNTRPLFSLVVRPEVQSPVDLKGQSVRRQLLRQHPGDSHGKTFATPGLEEG